MMIMVSLAKGGTKQFHQWKYQTNNGELDILSDSNFPVATFAKDQWVSVQRLKDDDEEWPEVEESDTQDRTGDSLLDGIPKPSFDYQPYQ